LAGRRLGVRARLGFDLQIATPVAVWQAARTAWCPLRHGVCLASHVAGTLSFPPRATLFLTVKAFATILNNLLQLAATGDPIP
jgi:hypothetical protein